MTLLVYSSATYIVCVLDSEGHRMGLESLLADCGTFLLIEM